jgi:surface carbohydrate biosynthesis protein
VAALARRDLSTVQEPTVSVFLPIDGLHRELDARLVLAGMCAEEGNRVFIGQHDVVFGLVPSTTGGVYLGKHIFNRIFSDPDVDTARYEAVKRRGMTLVHLDEEGGVLPGSDAESWGEALLIQLDPHALAADDHLLTWGEFQADLYRSRRPACARNIEVTGHPRFDLYKPQFRDYYAHEVRELHERYGSFLLYNTTFAAAQPKFGIADWFSGRQGYDPSSAARRARSIAIWASDTRKLTHAVDLCHSIASEISDRTLVIRPHPSEDPAIYRAVFASFPNVVVLNEGPVAPWILACDALIHSGCTTGMEGALAGTRVLYYRPDEDRRDEAEPLLPSLFGKHCRTVDAVLERLTAPRDAPATGDLDPRVPELIANFRFDALPAVARILRDAADAQRRPSARAPAEGRLRALEARRAAVGGAKGFVRPLFPARRRRFELFRSYFPGLDRATIRRKLGTVEKLLGIRLRSRFYGDSLLTVERAPR